jgi:sulfur carrier protein ThiS
MKLKLGGQLSFYLPGKPSEVEVKLESPTLLSEVLAKLGVPFGEVYLVVVNGELQSEPKAAIVSQDDEVKVFPPIDGG